MSAVTEHYCGDGTMLIYDYGGLPFLLMQSSLHFKHEQLLYRSSRLLHSCKMVNNVPENDLLVQVEKHFWATTQFICMHTEYEKVFWPQCVESALPESNLKLGRLDDDDTCRVELPLSQYPAIQRLVLDHVGVQKLVTLAEKLWRIEHVPNPSSKPGKPKDTFEFASRKGESRVTVLGDEHFEQAKRELNLPAVRELEIYLYDDPCPWVRTQGDATAVLQLDDLEVQRQLAIIFRCLPALEKIIVNRDFSKEFLKAKKKCISRKGDAQIVKETHGAFFAARLDRTDRQVQNFLENRFGKPRGLRALLEKALDVKSIGP